MINKRCIYLKKIKGTYYCINTKIRLKPTIVNPLNRCTLINDIDYATKKSIKIKRCAYYA